MHISFDSIDELDAFVARWSASVQTIDIPDPHITLRKPTERENAQAERYVMTDAEVAASNIPPEPDAAEVKTRKRRTKAEIAADEAAKAAESAPASTQEPRETDSKDEPKANPFAVESAAPAAAIQAILDAPNQQAASLAGMAAVSMNALPEEPAVATVAAAVKPTDPAIIASWIKDTAVGNIGPLDLIQHMTRAKAFIAKHTTAKYNESFALAGLTPNIMEYDDAQRSHHAAALEFLDWDGK